MNLFAPQNTSFSVNQSLDFVGHSSKYQKRTILAFSFAQSIFSFLVMGLPFILKPPVFLCDGSPCEQNQSCSQGVQVLVRDSTVTSSYHLYCGRQYLIGIIGSLLFFGQMVSGFIIPRQSAKKGRKYCLVLSLLISAIPLMLTTLLDSFPLFLLAIFLAGLGSNGFENEAIVYISEVSGFKFRNFSQVILNSSWALAQIIFAMLLQYIHSWRIVLAFVIALPLLFSALIIQWQVLESPRYLVAEQKYEEARDVLDQIAILNGRPHFLYSFEGEDRKDKRGVLKKLQRDIPMDENIAAQSLSYTYYDLFRYRSLRTVSCILLLLWTFRYCTYFGLAFSMLSLGDDMSDNFFFIAISEVLACLLAATIKLKIPRTRALAFFATLASLFCIGLIFPRIPLNCYHLYQTCTEKAIQVIFAMIIKFSITIYGEVLIAYTMEIYPTVVRSHALGLAMTVGKLGSVFMPFLVTWFQQQRLNPLFLFGIIGIVGLFGIVQLPETLNKKLQDYIEEDCDKPLIELT